jgi:hypothetical protein
MRPMRRSSSSGGEPGGQSDPLIGTCLLNGEWGSPDQSYVEEGDVVSYALGPIPEDTLMVLGWVRDVPEVFTDVNHCTRR